ncbi:MAG: trypsin-like serine protease, partial [Bacteroidales bacterium]|nr:trypsin-like serine protease [Bacteroidales bacterium]
YLAKLVISDRTNDLAIIKIEDKNFDKFSPIPFTIKSNIIDVGEEVFLLGYPLISSMGEEVKLTTGIVSSKSGFMNDITKYQISAPVQPGNSGGPLFDNNGNVIGIICAKHTGAENVSYAIKSTYLINLIGSIEKQPKLNKKNTISKKKLTDKIKILEKYVFIVTTNDI